MWLNIIKTLTAMLFIAGAGSVLSVDSAAKSVKIAAPADEMSQPNLREATLRLVGRWTGTANQPNSSGETAYTTELEFFLNGDTLEFRSWYPELTCGGTGKLTRELTRGASFYEQITQGRARCIDGDFLVTHMQGGKLFWDWGNGQATGILDRD